MKGSVLRSERDRLPDLNCAACCGCWVVFGCSPGATGWEERRLEMILILLKNGQAFLLVGDLVRVCQVFLGLFSETTLLRTNFLCLSLVLTYQFGLLWIRASIGRHGDC